jgi:hypothetical protein
MSATTRRESLSCADTAKLVRRILAESFPGVRFGVRSSTYAGGASIRINWVDGPTVRQVDATAGRLSGAYFDGMTDYQGANYHTLDGRPVRFGANFIFGDRRTSPAALEATIMHLFTTRAEFASQPWPAILTHDDGTAYIDTADPVCTLRVGPDWGSSLIYQVGYATSHTATMPSPTLARIAFTHDDGYSRSVGSRG